MAKNFNTLIIDKFFNPYFILPLLTATLSFVVAFNTVSGNDAALSGYLLLAIFQTSVGFLNLIYTLLQGEIINLPPSNRVRRYDFIFTSIILMALLFNTFSDEYLLILVGLIVARITIFLIFTKSPLLALIFSSIVSICLTLSILIENLSHIIKLGLYLFVMSVSFYLILTKHSFFLIPSRATLLAILDRLKMSVLPIMTFTLTNIYSFLIFAVSGLPLLIFFDRMVVFAMNLLLSKYMHTDFWSEVNLSSSFNIKSKNVIWTSLFLTLLALFVNYWLNFSAYLIWLYCFPGYYMQFCSSKLLRVFQLKSNYSDSPSNRIFFLSTLTLVICIGILLLAPIAAKIFVFNLLWFSTYFSLKYIIRHK